ncbi:nucleotidyltransferase family protein [Chengkuizengella sediminis]|uniref:nucleotidyltransferase family protein n=1 Tax=Chengkuizengella sediminis TaxID=1885917 RepID=UPI001389CF92|nr:nucleotidyltransferase family protein [Chengkuizengella sediminis]
MASIIHEVKSKPIHYRKSIKLKNSSKNLSVNNKLFHLFHQENIKYCHFKSNEHLDEGLIGKTDLDILVDRSQYVKIQELLKLAGFKLFYPTVLMKYPAVDDYIALDKITGELSHIHLHYRLTLGEKYLKGYSLRWEKIILNTRILNLNQNIYIIDPNFEMILLLVRHALKLRLRDIRFALSRNDLQKEFNQEYIWLKQRIIPSECLNIYQSILGQVGVETFKELIHSKPNLFNLFKFKKSIHHALRGYRSYGNFSSLYLRTVRECNWVLSGINKRFFRFAFPYRRTLPAGGLVISFIGCDGSGKSTMIKELIPLFSWKIDTYKEYLGSGGGSSSILRYPLKLMKKWFINKLFNKQTSLKEDMSNAKKHHTRFKTFAKFVWALTLAYEKRNKLIKIWKLRNLGLMVITDRYPQLQVKGSNDGPLLHEWKNHKNWIIKYFANWESRPYEWANKNPPDIVVRLNVTAENAYQRKKDMKFEEFKKRVGDISSLKFNEKSTVVEINADQPLNQVLSEVKYKIWSHI